MLNQTVIIPIEPWGGFTNALNIATAHAAEKGIHFIAFQSLEITISKDIVSVNDRNFFII